MNFENEEKMKGHPGSVDSIAFSSDGALIASGSTDCAMKLWDVGSGRAIATLKVLTPRKIANDVHSVAFYPDGTLIATGSWDGMVKLWDVKARSSSH